MGKITFTLTMATIISGVFAAETCNYAKSMRTFESRANLVGKPSGETRELAEDSSAARIQRIYPKLKSGINKELSKFAVYGFIGCRLHSVRTGLLVGRNDPEPKGEMTVYLRESGVFKAICKGNGDVYKIDPTTVSIRAMIEGGGGRLAKIPNTDCVCYDADGIEREFGPTGCIEDSDLDPNGETLSHSYLDFMAPNAKPEREAPRTPGKLNAAYVERDMYFSGPGTQGLSAKEIAKVARKGMSDIVKAVSDFPTDDVIGRVTLQVTVAENGTVSNAEVRSATVGTPAISNAIRDAVLGWKFPKKKSASVFFLPVRLRFD